MTAETYDFDTSGAVCIETARDHACVATRMVRWSDLSPFVQGYIRAAFAELSARLQGPERVALWFGNLHPDTLESMLADCANFRPVEGSEPDDVKRIKGGMFWRYRQDGAYARVGFPPIRLSLDPNGKVVATADGPTANPTEGE